MPFRWTDPELFMQHRAMRIYHTYEDDDSETPLAFWYAVANGKEFDVRDLPTVDGITAWSWSSREMKVEVSAGKDVHRRIIKAVIEAREGPFARPLGPTG